MNACSASVRFPEVSARGFLQELNNLLHLILIKLAEYRAERFECGHVFAVAESITFELGDDRVDLVGDAVVWVRTCCWRSECWRSWSLN